MRSPVARVAPAVAIAAVLLPRLHPRAGSRRDPRSAGDAPEGLVYPNMKKRSAGHGGDHFATAARVVIANRRLNSPPSIVDVTPTVSKDFGAGVPLDIDGKASFQ